MKFKRIFLTFLIVALGVLAWFFSTQANHREKIAGVKTLSLKMAGKPRGLILPHHDLAKELIDQTLEKIRQRQEFSYVVIFGPSHFQTDGYNLATSQRINNYPLAINLIKQLTSQAPTIVDDQSLLENEHSITSLLPYLQHYFPKALFLPIISSPFHIDQEIEETVSFLTRNLPEDTLYIASLDFSHEKMALEALEKNNETLEVIKNFDYQTLYRLEDDHLDSPVAAALTLKIMEELKAVDWETWHNTHGAILKNDPTLQGTSYVIGVFR